VPAPWTARKSRVAAGAGGAYISVPDVRAEDEARTDEADRPRRRRMTGTSRTSDGLDSRRKRLLFRAWHRGTREMDLLLGRFTDHALDGLDAEELDLLEALMEVPDRDLFAWIVGRESTPDNYDTSLFRRLKAFHLPA